MILEPLCSCLTMTWFLPWIWTPESFSALIVKHPWAGGAFVHLNWFLQELISALWVGQSKFPSLFLDGWMDGHQWLHRPFRNELRSNCGLLEFPTHSLWVFTAQLQAHGSNFRDQERRASCGFALASIPLAKSNTGSATRGISEKPEENGAGAVSGAVVWVGHLALEIKHCLLKALAVGGIISSSPLGVILCVMEKWDWVGWVSRLCPFFWRVWQFGGTSWSPALFSSVGTSGCLWADPGFLRSHSIPDMPGGWVSFNTWQCFRISLLLHHCPELANSEPDSGFMSWAFSVLQAD